jgi:hypothetical protein
MPSIPFHQTYSEPPLASPAGDESLDGTAGLKPEPSICYSKFGALDYRDGDNSSR